MTKKKPKYSKYFLQSVQAGKKDTLIQKVAHILNHYPIARDSDIALSIKLLQTFYPEFIDEYGKFSLKDLHKIPKFYDMQRDRAKIQNTYGLFQPSPEVKLFREKRQVEEAEQFVSQSHDYSPVFVFADESGKSDKHLIVGTVWLYSASSYYEATDALKLWRKNKSYKKEFHFKNLKSIEEADLALDFFSAMFSSISFYALKAIIIPNLTIPSNRRLDSVYEAISENIISGLKFEYESSRISPPTSIHLIKDADSSTDRLKIFDLNRRIVNHLQAEFQNNLVTLEGKQVQSIPAEKNDIVQATDLFTSSLGRIINHPTDSLDGNPKTHLSSSMLSYLNITLDSNGLPQSDSDFCKLFYL